MVLVVDLNGRDARRGWALSMSSRLGPNEPLS
jgi:hypothetical protein